MKFKVGNKVRHEKYGVGEIVYIDCKYYVSYAVKFKTYNDELQNLFTLKKYGIQVEDGHGYWCGEDEIELIDEPQNLTPFSIVDALIDLIQANDTLSKRIAELEKELQDTQTMYSVVAITKQSERQKERQEIRKQVVDELLEWVWETNEKYADFEYQEYVSISDLKTKLTEIKGEKNA